MEGYAEKNGVISFFSRGSFSDCGLYLEVPKKEVLSGLSRMRLFLIGIFGAVFVAAVLLALWLSRVVCGPLRSMTGTVEKVGEGVQYPWEGHEELHPGQIPERFNPVASYVRYFHVPESMKGKRVFVSFQGAESGLALWLNGKFVGTS